MYKGNSFLQANILNASTSPYAPGYGRKWEGGGVVDFSVQSFTYSLNPLPGREGGLTTGYQPAARPSFLGSEPAVSTPVSGFLEITCPPPNPVRS